MPKEASAKKEGGCRVRLATPQGMDTMGRWVQEGFAGLGGGVVGDLRWSIGGEKRHENELNRLLEEELVVED